MKQKTNFTSLEKARNHDVTMPLLQALYDEFKELSKKKPDAGVSKSKITLVNRLLERVRTVLNDEDCIVFLDLLDEDNVPQISDVTIILSQYVAAMNDFHSRYYGYNGTKHDWFVK